MKATMAMILATAAVIVAMTVRPRCDSVAAAVASPPPPRATVASVPEPLKIASFDVAVCTLAPQRNVFAFGSVSVEDRRPRLSPVPVEHGQAEAPVLHRETMAIVAPPPYQYLGSFGPQETPILVYKGQGEVVNVPLRKP